MKKKKKSTATWIYEFAGEYQSSYVISIVLSLLGVALAIIPYLLIAQMIQQLLSKQMDWLVYLHEGFVLALLWLLSVLAKKVSTTFSHRATFQVLGNMREAVSLHLSKMELGRVQSYSSGTLKNIMVERIDSIETTLAHIVPEVSGNMVIPILIFVYLFFLDWRMALIALIPLPIGITAYMLMMNGYEEDYKNTIDKTKILNDTAVEYIQGIEVIKAFGKSKTSYEKFVVAAKEGASCYVDWMNKHRYKQSTALTVAPNTLLFVLPFGLWFVMNGSLSTYHFIVIILLSMGLLTPLITMMSYSDDMARIRTIVGEVVGILENPIQNHAESLNQSVDNYHISLKNVHFSYQEKEVLHGIDLEIPEGKLTAFVGPSGSGKSTIAKLIAALWDVKEGSISIGSVNGQEIPLKDYYRLVSFVSQDNYLFNQSIRENIRMGKPDASDEEVEKIAKESGCHEFIMALPNGYDTIVGEAGGHLSGGERQRIAIARTMIANTPIVILDEATAYTDPENEAIIQQSVARLVKDKTLIVIAHRLSTIQDADQICMIEKGKVIAQGKHEDLLNSCPLYQSMWQAHISVKDEGMEVVK
ncbi:MULTISPECIES: ABC transporter ATP-binding protein [Terrabacteria group]|uniref:ABC transporter ATP-binding protein n=1 Tax=Bacillati TaxID=1783272 RepID=UPI001C6E1D45|nr:MULTISPECIES: ABC transporter ATP-binding protein [Terrabacteria group]MBW9211957.1 ABC transporter ATP-binding protein/permease [Trueperella sp. zg.1013]